MSILRPLITAASAYIETGVAAQPARLAAKFRVLNFLCLYASFVIIPFFFIYVWVDALALLYLELFILVGGIITFSMPFVFRRNVYIYMHVFSLLWIAGVMLICFYLGTASGIHFVYLSFCGIWACIYGLERIVELSFWMLVGLASFFLCFHTMDVPYYAESDAFLAPLVLYTWGINAFILICGIVVYALLLAERAERALAVEHLRSERLLRNILPDTVADRLKSAPDETIADNLPDVTFLFADIVDFTPRATNMAAADLVRFLDRIFTEFDRLTADRGLTKIKTIGDAYMVASGMPEPRTDHAAQVAELAFEMLAVCRDLSVEFEEAVEVRIGLHTGPAVAGVIGTQRFAYDAWGDTVNTAARMESHGEPVKIQVTEATKNALNGRYDFEPRGSVEIKGKGMMETWWLHRHSASSST